MPPPPPRPCPTARFLSSCFLVPAFLVPDKFPEVLLSLPPGWQKQATGRTGRGPSIEFLMSQLFSIYTTKEPCPLFREWAVCWTSMFLFLLPGSLESNSTAMVLAFMACKMDASRTRKTKTKLHDLNAFYFKSSPAPFQANGNLIIIDLHRAELDAGRPQSSER